MRSKTHTDSRGNLESPAGFNMHVLGMLEENGVHVENPHNENMQTKERPLMWSALETTTFLL